MNDVNNLQAQSSEDPLWPRANSLLGRDSGAPIAIIGVPACETSISPTRADTTPGAVRDALRRYSTFSATHDIDLENLNIFDAGDVESPDHEEGEARVALALDSLRERIVIAIGGDNSITYSVATALAGESIKQSGLITFDAHHDLRDGISNGSPVRRLVEAGMPGENIVQVGIADFSNSAHYARRAHDMGITVIPRADFNARSIGSIVDQAIEVASQGGGPVHVDIDVDVCDRSVVPGCPAAAPGGLSAHELRQVSFLMGADSRVGSVDFTEVDAQADSPDDRTVRLVALCILEFLCGVASRDL